MAPGSLQQRLGKMRARFAGASLLTATATAAGVAAIANAMALAAPPPTGEVPTRLGTSIAESMRDRDRAQTERKRALDLREQTQRAAEQRLRSDLQASQPVAPANVPPGAPAATPQDTALDDLANIYQTMKPARAAPIFEKLALDVQVMVVKRMRERQTALIMAAMTPDAAVELSMAVAGRQVVKAPPSRAAEPPRPVVTRSLAAVPAAGRRRTANTAPAPQPAEGQVAAK